MHYSEMFIETRGDTGGIGPAYFIHGKITVHDDFFVSVKALIHQVKKERDTRFGYIFGTEIIYYEQVGIVKFIVVKTAGASAEAVILIRRKKTCRADINDGVTPVKNIFCNAI